MVQSFTSNNRGNKESATEELKVGMEGDVKDINADGDANIRFHNLSGMQWVFKTNYNKLQKIGAASRYAIGEFVSARYTGDDEYNGMWFRATICGVNSDGTYQIAWDDGTTQDLVKTLDELQKRPPPQKHQQFVYGVGHIPENDAELRSVLKSCGYNKIQIDKAISAGNHDVHAAIDYILAYSDWSDDADGGWS